MASVTCGLTDQDQDQHGKPMLISSMGLPLSLPIPGQAGCPKGFPEQKTLGIAESLGLLNWNVLYRLDALPVTQPTACMLTAQRVG